MCGIFGYKNFDFDTNLIASELYHRGPDSFSIKSVLNWTFIHRRLAIIDISENALQPMEYMGNILLFNGEIYNYKELKEEYLKDMYFVSSSDSEVLLKLLCKYGLKILNKLNGMFAFAYYDSNTNSVFLCRDRYGVKPLYYYVDNNSFAFASEDSILQKLLNLPFDLNTEYLKNLFFHNMSDYDENSFVKKIFAVKPGEYIEIKIDNKLIKNKYYNFNDYNFSSIKKNNFNEIIDNFEELLIDSIKIRNRSDCKIAMTLSGGIDSGVIYTLSKEKIGLDYTLFTYSNAGNLDEYRKAELLAKQYGDNIIKIEFNKQNSYENYKKSLLALNAPIWSCAHAGYFDVYKTIKECGFKVVLEGHGADELFGGWPFLFPVAAKNAISNNDFILALNIIRLYFSSNKITINRKNLVDVVKYVFDLSNCDKYLFDKTMNYIFTKKILPINLRCWDRIQMANSIESRSPFLDYRVVEFSRALPLNYKINSIGNKAILRYILKKYKQEKIYKNKIKQPFLASEIEFLTQNSRKMLEFYNRDEYNYDISDWEQGTFFKGYNPQIYKACAIGFLKSHYGA